MRRSVAQLLFIALFACSETPGSPEGSPSSKILRFQVSGEAEEVAVYDTLINAFEKDNPDLAVRTTVIADKDDHLAKLATSFSGGNPPDVFLVNFREYSQFVAQQGVKPVEDLLANLEVEYGDYFEEPLEAFTYDGTLQCMPQNISSLVVYYNKTLFKNADLKRPPDAWSWAEFRDYAIALTQGEVDGLGIEPSVIRAAPFVWSNGGEVVDNTDAPTRFVLDEPAAREALEFIVDLVREDSSVPTEEEITAQDLETRFMTSKLGMLLSSRRDTPAFREVTGLDWDVAALPRAEQRAGILHSDGYCISAGSEQVEAAAEFVAFATGDEGQTITALAGRTVPSLKSVAKSGAFLDPSQPPAHPEVFIEGISHIRRTPVIPTWPQIEDLAEEIFTRMFYEPGYTIEQGLRELDAESRPLFEEASNE
jgi:multiple sugar transport system substrate-binding protein